MPLNLAPPLSTNPPAALIALSKHPRFRWLVYDAPQLPPPLASPGQRTGWLGRLTYCCPFNPSLEFMDR